MSSPLQEEARDDRDQKRDACTCYTTVKTAVASAFMRYGVFVGRHPLPFIVIPIVVFGGLGAGLVSMETETDMEVIYFPKTSRALNDRQFVRDTFPDMNNVSFNAFSQSDLSGAVTLLFKSKSGDILNTTVLNEIKNIVTQMKSVKVSAAGRNVTFSDVCARINSVCAVDGEYALSPDFQAALAAGMVTYPYWNTPAGTIALFTAIAGIQERSGVLLSASVLRLTFHLLTDTFSWHEEFLSFAHGLDPVYTEVAYKVPDSLNEELNKSTSGDIWLFSLTITLMLAYASLVTAGGNPVSTRGMLANGGVLAAGLAILGSMGLLSVCGVKFVNIVGVIPFLIIGIGMDDMFLLMSGWSETLSNTELSVPDRVGATFASAGIGITITSITDFLAFVIGTTSIFRSVTNFSLYAGVAVLFCYICNATLFGGCLAYHGRRVYSSRHFATCQVTKSRDQLLADGHSKCYAVCCGGSMPVEERADESICEKIPRLFLPKVILSNVIRVVTVLVFVGYLVVAAYGAANLRQGLLLRNLVPESSYYFKYLALDEEYFPMRLPVGFIATKNIDYGGKDGVAFLDLLHKARQDQQVDSTFERCWLTAYKNSPQYNVSSPGSFVANLHHFLNANINFRPDVVFDDSHTEVAASRCFVWSEPSSDQYVNADLMVRMREVADTSPLPVFAFHAAFVAYEQFLCVLPATLQMVGCAVAVIFVVTFIFLPHLLMVMLVTLTIVMILVGIFGFMYYWDISLSSVSMIHLIMSVGFSVDFSAHVCAAYLISNSASREERAYDAITHAAGPIMNGAVSTLLGVMLLAFSDSYVFTTFFRIMFLVIVFGVMHAVLFLPVVLSILGPQSPPALPPGANTDVCKISPTVHKAENEDAPGGDRTDGEYSEEVCVSMSVVETSLRDNKEV